MRGARQGTVVLAMTGASGAQYGLRLLQCIIRAGVRTHLILSKPAYVVIGMETDLRLPGNPAAAAQFLSGHFDAAEGQLSVFGLEQWTAPIASGSSAPDAMVICPCSTGTLSAVACGGSRTLIERAADVVLKERRRLIVVVRETPLSQIHLENMLKLSRMGAVIMPANPGFYHRPTSIGDLVDFMVARILDHLDIEHELMARWGEEKAPVSER